MGLSFELQEATRRKPRKSKPKKARKVSKGEEILLAAAARVKVKVEDPDMLDDALDMAMTDLVSTMFERLYNGKRKFKTTRTDDIADDEQVNYGTWDNPDEVYYNARVDYPVEVTNVTHVTLKPQDFSKSLVEELDVSPASAAKKIASDREVLAYAGKQLLEATLKWMENPPDENSDMAKQAEDFAYKNAEDVRMSADPKQSEILHVAELELEVRSVDQKVSFSSPWKFKVETTFEMKGDLEWMSYD